MDIRKVQVTGGSSYVISLPKSWIKAMKIEKNDPLGLEIQPDNTLLITTKIAGEKEEIEKEFNVDIIDKPEFLFRSLIGAYIAGYGVIKLNSKKRMLPFVRTVARDFTQMTIGQEVVEETENTIVIKDLLNPMEMPFNSTLRRMYVIAKGMHQDAMRILEKREKILAEDVISRDNDVDRLHWLIARQSSILLRNVTLAQKMDIEPGNVINYFLISRFIERIGDHAVNMIKNIENLSDRKIDKNLLEMIEAADKLTMEIFDKSMESLFKNKIQLANESIELVHKLLNLCRKINTQVLSRKGIEAVSLGYIVESVRRTGVYSGDIAESVINHIVRNEV